MTTQTNKKAAPGIRIKEKAERKEKARKKAEAARILQEIFGPHPGEKRNPHAAASRLMKSRERKEARPARQYGQPATYRTPVPAHLLDPPPHGVVEMEATAVEVSAVQEAPAVDIPVQSLAAPAAQKLDGDVIDSIRDRIRRICEAGIGFSQSRVAREMQIASATLSQFLGGTYAGNTDAIALKAKNWLTLHDERQNNESLPACPTWVDTPTSRRILADLRYAQMAHDLVVIIGGAGVGKSATIKQYASINPAVWHIQLSPATGTMVKALEEIAIAVGIRDYILSASVLQREIARRIRNINGLLVIDEAQHLTVQALDQIRWFYDHCDVGLVFCGNERVYGQMTGGNRAAYLDRLFSRVGKKSHIKRVTAADADALIKAWGIDDAIRDQIRTIANRPGALRVLNKVLRLAAMYAQAKGKRISMDEITVAARELGVFE